METIAYLRIIYDLFEIVIFYSYVQKEKIVIIWRKTMATHIEEKHRLILFGGYMFK